MTTLRPLFSPGDGWASRIAWPGTIRLVADLLKELPAWHLEVRGSKAQGWAVYMVPPSYPVWQPCQVSPLFVAEHGDTRRALVEACWRAYAAWPIISRQPHVGG